MKNIYILPGWAYGLAKWESFIVELKAVGLNPIILEIPGLHLNIDKPWNVNDYVSWLNDKLENKDKVILLGHSNGGRIALSYCLKYPKKVEKLVLIDSAGIYHNELPIRVKRIIFKYLAKIGKKVNNYVSLKNLLYKFARESDYNQAPEVMKKTMQNLIKHDLTDNLKKIYVKTLIIWGENDKITPLSDGILINKEMINSELKIIKLARHSPHFTQVKKVTQLVKKFV